MNEEMFQEALLDETTSMLGTHRDRVHITRVPGGFNIFAVAYGETPQLDFHFSWVNAGDMSVAKTDGYMKLYRKQLIREACKRAFKEGEEHMKEQIGKGLVELALRN